MALHYGSLGPVRRQDSDLAPCLSGRDQYEISQGGLGYEAQEPPKQEGFFKSVARAFKEGAFQDTVRSDREKTLALVESDDEDGHSVTPLVPHDQPNKYTANLQNLNTDPVYKGEGFVAQRVASVKAVSIAAKKLEFSSYAGKVFVKVTGFAFNNAAGRYGSAALLGLTNGLVRAVPRALSSSKWEEVSGVIGVLGFLAAKLMTAIGSIGVLGLDLGLTVTRAVVGIAATLAVALPAALVTGIVELFVATAKLMYAHKKEILKAFLALLASPFVLGAIGVVVGLTIAAFAVTVVLGTAVAVAAIIPGLVFLMHKYRAQIAQAFKTAGTAMLNAMRFVFEQLKALGKGMWNHKAATLIALAALAILPFTIPVALALAVPLSIALLLISYLVYRNDNSDQKLDRVLSELESMRRNAAPAAFESELPSAYLVQTSEDEAELARIGAASFPDADSVATSKRRKRPGSRSRSPRPAPSSSSSSSSASSAASSSFEVASDQQ